MFGGTALTHSPLLAINRRRSSTQAEPLRFVPGTIDDGASESGTSGKGNDVTSTSTDDSDEDAQLEKWEPMDRDAYGAAICSIIKDLYWLDNGAAHIVLRVLRCVLSIGLITFLSSMQIFLVYELRVLVTTRAVHNIREVYANYQSVMYENGTFVKENFEKFSEDEAGTICEVPLSQPVFFATMVFIWSFSVMNSFRRTCELCYKLFYVTPLVKRAGDMLHWETDGECLLLGLTLFVKLAIALTVMLPRTLLNIFLLWLGAQWLAATLEFGEIVLNAVALEFVLLLKDVFFTVVVSKRLMLETAYLRMMPDAPKSRATPFAFFSSYAYALVSGVWVYLYLFHWQRVLPDYKWDIRDVCHGYLHDHADTFFDWSQKIDVIGDEVADFLHPNMQ